MGQVCWEQACRGVRAGVRRPQPTGRGRRGRPGCGGERGDRGTLHGHALDERQSRNRGSCHAGPVRLKAAGAGVHLPGRLTGARPRHAVRQGPLVHQGAPQQHPGVTGVRVVRRHARLRRERQRVRAREQLRAAVDVFGRLGVGPWSEMARAELAATGVTVRRRDMTTLNDLTPQELQIALSLAEGRTTRETAAALFLSPKTIEYHLRSVYRKLSIGSRSELKAAGTIGSPPGKPRRQSPGQAATAGQPAGPRPVRRHRSPPGGRRPGGRSP